MWLSGQTLNLVGRRPSVLSSILQTKELPESKMGLSNAPWRTVSSCSQHPQLPSIACHTRYSSRLPNHHYLQVEQSRSLVVPTRPCDFNTVFHCRLQAGSKEAALGPPRSREVCSPPVCSRLLPALRFHDSRV